MPLLSLEELAEELSVSSDLIRDLVAKEILIPYGGRARLGEPRFSARTLSKIRTEIKKHLDSR